MLILASNSPRRRQLLALGGWDFEVLPAEIDETPFPEEAPPQYVYRVALTKARVVAEQAGPEAVVVAADTAVVDHPPGGTAEILVKPVDAAEAGNMLRRLKGRTHQVLTGLVVLRNSDQRMMERIFSTGVTMRNYSDREMLEYITSGDPMDKAGAYAIQNESFHPVVSLDGCYTNVVGLPLCGVFRMLAELGLPPAKPLPYACFHDPEVDCTFPPEILYQENE